MIKTGDIPEEYKNQSKQEEEKKPVDYLADAKDKYREMNYLNSSYHQSAQTAALIFIGEQLAKQNDVLEGVNNALEFILEAVQQNGLR